MSVQKKSNTLIAVSSLQAALTKFVLCSANQITEIKEKALVDKIKDTLVEEVAKIGSLSHSPNPASYSQAVAFFSYSSKSAVISTSVRMAP